MNKNRKMLLGVVITFLTFLVLGMVAWWLAQTQQASQNEEPPTRMGEQAPLSQPTGPIKDLKTIDVKPGEGSAVKHGDQVEVQYTGWLYEPNAPDNKGSKFDSSRDRGEPFKFRLGVGQVITGWDKGVEGMKAGGTRLLIVPSEMGYGERGAGAAIPPNATLLFEIELLRIIK